MERCTLTRLGDKPAQEAAHQRADNAQHCGSKETHVLSTGHDRSCDQPDDEPHNDRPDDMEHGLPPFSPRRARVDGCALQPESRTAFLMLILEVGEVEIRWTSA